MGAKRTAKKAVTKKAVTKKAATKKAAAKKAAAKRAPRPRAPALSPDALAARIAATGLVSTAYLLPWEPIHGPGDYAAIARALRDLAGGGFPIERVSDTVDLAAEHASLELSLGGVHHVLEALIVGPQVDDGILVMLGALFETWQERQPQEARRRFFVDPITCEADKTSLLICATPEATRAVNAAAGAAFTPVTEL